MILKRNRRILKKLYNPQKIELLFTREELMRDGVEFGFMTHIAVTKGKRNEIVFCYDYGMREVKKGLFQRYPSFSMVQVKNGYKVKGI